MDFAKRPRLRSTARVLLSYLLVLAVTAAPARYVLTVQGVPLAELRVSVEGRRYRYESTHFLEEGPRERRRDFELDEAGRVDGRAPEVLALAAQPAVGCVEVLEEVTRAPERLCVDEVQGRTVRGTIAGQPFTAHYDDGRRLRSLELAAARWDATSTPAAAPSPEDNPFTRGFALEGTAGRATLAPAMKGARRLETAPRGLGEGDEVGRTRCLVAARRYVAAHPKAALVLGLVVEDGRAWPHAWIREGGRDGDPSVRPGDVALAGRQYLELPAADAGRVYLELLDGARRVRLVPR